MLTSPKLATAIAVTRFGLGGRPGEMASVGGDARAFLKSQINSEGADQPSGDLGGAVKRLREFRNAYQEGLDIRYASAATMFVAPRSDETTLLYYAATIMDELDAKTHMAVKTKAGFRERWAQFWANHFSVSQRALDASPTVGAFEREAIRPNVFGKFGDLLLASSRHLTMIAYLEQQRSAGPSTAFSAPATKKSFDAGETGLLDTMARKILDTHTIGKGGGYGPADVRELALALTGWSVGLRTYDPIELAHYIYRAEYHEPGARTVLGKSFSDTGEAQAADMLAYIAVHPATASHLAHKIAAHFVSDDPPASLVEKLKGVYLASSGDLAQVAVALIDADESWALEPAKVKSHYEWVVSAFRAFDFEPYGAPELWNALYVLGQQPYNAPTPSGWPDKAQAWASPDSLIGRIAWAESFGEAASDLPTPVVDVAQACLGARLSPRTSAAIASEPDRAKAIALLLLSPEFQRR